LKFSFLFFEAAKFSRTKFCPSKTEAVKRGTTKPAAKRAVHIDN
jgi:hypothetical protein